MSIQHEHAEDLIDTDPLEILIHMDDDQIAGTIRALYWAKQQNDTQSINIFVNSLTQAFYDTAWDITEKKLNEANVYEGPFDEMYDVGHLHGDFI